MDVRSLLDNSSYEDIRDTIAALAASAEAQSIDDLKQFLLNRDSHTYYKHAVPRLACLGLLQKGPVGVRALSEVLPDAPGSIYPASIVEALWHASRGQTPNRIFLNQILSPIPPLDAPLPTGTAESAQEAIHDLVADSIENEDKFRHLLQFLSQENWSPGAASEESNHEFRSRVFELFTSGRIRVNTRLISQFELLLSSSEKEERYHRFLASNPVFLDPLASLVISKQRLGIEHVTDFVVRRLDDKYILVEIEKSQDEIFTAADDFSAKFTHALGQVLDFQQWIDSHGEYARSLMPLISSPKGLLIIGRSTHLTPKQQAKLHRFNLNSAAIQVLTFDDIAQNARRLYENICKPIKEKINDR
jgi:hypothetical protein